MQATRKLRPGIFRERTRSNSIAQYWSPCRRLVKKMIAEVGADSEIGIVAYRKHTVMLDLIVYPETSCVATMYSSYLVSAPIWC